MKKDNRSLNMMQRTVCQFPASWYQQFSNRSQLPTPMSVPYFTHSYPGQDNRNAQNQNSSRVDSRYMQYLAWNPQYYYNPYTFPIYFQPSWPSVNNQNRNSEIENRFVDLIENVLERRALKYSSNDKECEPCERKTNRKALIKSPERKRSKNLNCRSKNKVSKVSSPIITKVSSPLPLSKRSTRNYLNEDFQSATSETSVSLSLTLRSEDSWSAQPEISFIPHKLVKKTPMSAGERIMSIPENKIQELTSNVALMFASHEGEDLYPLEKWLPYDVTKDTGDTESNIRFLMNLLNSEKLGPLGNKLTKRQKRDLAGMIESQVSNYKLKGEEWVKVCEDIVVLLGSKANYIGN